MFKGGGTGTPTIDPTTGMPSSSVTTGIDPNNPLGTQFAKAGLAGMTSPALQNLLNPPQSRGGPMPPLQPMQQPYVPPPQLNNPFFGG
jgi:hypothetical protein